MGEANGPSGGWLYRPQNRFLFGSPQSLATETVLSCLSAKSESIRLQATEALFTRNKIALKAAETLLSDSNHDIRLLSAESLKKLFHGLGDDITRKGIVKPSSSLLTRLDTKAKPTISTMSDTLTVDPKR